MAAGMLMPSYYPAVSFDSPGSVTLSARGAWSFVVPNFRDSLEIELIGAGAGGGGAGSSGGTFGGTGGDTTCPGLGMTAGGGKGGAGASGTNNAGGAGGTASGGDTNTSGGAGGNSTSGLSGVGGSAPNGGIGGAGVTANNTRGNDGGPPGGGASGGKGSPNPGGGGGAGARSVKTFARGALVPGSTLSGVIGQGGVGYSGSAARGGDGADGQVKITWTGGTAAPEPEVPLTLSLPGINASVNSGSLTIPATAQVGDIAVFSQYAFNSSGSAPTAVDFPGATTVIDGVGGAGNRARCMCSVKVLTAEDINTPLTGMTGDAAQKTVRIIRPSRAVGSLTVGTPFGHSGTSSFLSTIDAPAEAPGFTFGRLLNSQSALTVQGSLTSSGDSYNEAIGANYRTWLEIQNGPTLSSRTLGSTNSTGLLLGQGFSISVS